MKTVIVYAHPNEQSFCNAILGRAVFSSRKNSNTSTVIDLYQDNFNPVMSKEELRGILDHKVIDPKARSYINTIKQSDHLVLIFPIWWTSMPAMVKGFIDKVVFPGELYDYKANGHGLVGLMPSLKVTIITTMDSPSFIYRFLYGNVIKKALINGTFKAIGIRNIKWLSFGNVKRSTRKSRIKWLKQVDDAIER